MGEAKRRRKKLGQVTPYVDLATGQQSQGRWGGDPRAVLTGIASGQSRVPCNGCKECCYHTRVDVDPQEEPPERLKHLSVERDENGYYWLQKRPDGSCAHLGENGCTVYDYRPSACRSYDCRLYAITGILDRYDGDHKQPVWLFEQTTPEGRALLAAAQALGSAEALRRSQTEDDMSARSIAVAVFGAAKLTKAYDAMLTIAKLPPGQAAEVLGIDPDNPADRERLAKAAKSLRDRIENRSSRG